MKNSLRDSFLEIIAGLEEQGVELGIDSVAMDLTYPEHPEVSIHISIGGHIHDAVEPEDGAH